MNGHSPPLSLTRGGTESELQMGGSPTDGAVGDMTQTLYVGPLLLEMKEEHSLWRVEQGCDWIRRL